MTGLSQSRFIENLKNFRAIMIIVVTFKGGVGGNKLQINPTYLTHSTQTMLHKALRLMTSVGFVEYVGLCGAFFGGDG
jgi:hypothetical protein